MLPRDYNVFGVSTMPPYKTHSAIYIVPGLLGIVLLSHGLQSSLPNGLRSRDRHDAASAHAPHRASIAGLQAGVENFATAITS